MTTYYIGIDPGLSGAVCCITNNAVVRIADLPAGKGYPEPYEVYRLISAIVDGCADGEVHIAIEQTQTRPGQGVVAAHKYGIGYGTLLGVCYSLEPNSLRTIYPKVWQFPLWSAWGGHMTTDDDTKQKTLQSVKRAWPIDSVQSLLVTDRGKLIDGRSDALGIATWLREVTK